MLINLHLITVYIAIKLLLIVLYINYNLYSEFNCLCLKIRFLCVEWQSDHFMKKKGRDPMAKTLGFFMALIAMASMAVGRDSTGWENAFATFYGDISGGETMGKSIYIYIYNWGYSFRIY